MTRRRWVPSLLLSGAWLALAAPAHACMNELEATIRHDEGTSFAVGMAAIVAMLAIVRPALDAAGSMRAVLAGWLVSAATVCVLTVILGVLSIHLNESGLAFAFAASLVLPPTYRFLRERRRLATLADDRPADAMPSDAMPADHVPDRGMPNDEEPAAARRAVNGAPSSDATARDERAA